MSKLKHKATYWINALQLSPHPEGGFFKRVIESENTIEIKKNVYRKSYSSIFYLLENKDFSAFHKLKSDEIWNFYSGGYLIIYIIKKDGEMKEVKLGPEPDKGEQLQVVIERDQWFAARPGKESNFSLVGCTVIPGFDFDDWKLAKRVDLIKEYPQHKKVITELTTSYS